MEKCDFCKETDILESTKLLGARPVQLERGGKICRMEVWLFDDDMEEQPKIHTGIVEYGNVEAYSTIDIPINFCPRCGKKLKQNKVQRKAV